MCIRDSILIDFDRVDVSNLNRQQYLARQVGELKAAALAENLRAIAPYTELEPHAERITEDNFASLLAGADVICEAFDRPEAKAMLCLLYTSWHPCGDVPSGSG